MQFFPMRRLLAAWGEAERAAAPRRHRHWTPACPALGRIAQAVVEGWRPDELAHVRDCPYCQRVLACEWRAGCVPVLEIVRYLAERSDLAPSIREHLEVDACPRCCRLARSRVLAAVAAPWRRWDVEPLEAGQALAWKLTLPPAGVAFAEATRPPFQTRLFDEATGLTVTLLERPDGRLVAYIESDDGGLAETTYRLELVGLHSQVDDKVRLRAVRAGGCAGQLTFGPAGELLESLGAEPMVVLCPLP